MAVKKLFEKVEMRQPVTVYDTRKVDVNHVFLYPPFCVPMFKKTYRTNNAKKRTIPSVLKNVQYKKYLALKMGNIRQQDVKQLQKFFHLPCLVYKYLQFWELEKFTCHVFLGRPKTLPRCLIFKTLLCEILLFRTLLFIFQTNVQKFCTKINKHLPTCSKKGPFRPFTLDD